MRTARRKEEEGKKKGEGEKGMNEASRESTNETLAENILGR